MKKLVIVFVLIIASAQVFAQTTTNQTTYNRPDATDRFRKYLVNTVGPTALIAPVISATFRQIKNRPEEWEKTGAGFARRFGDSFGRNLINQTVTYGLDEALKLDSNYYVSKKPNFKSKFSNAVVSTFTARTPSGKRVIGAPKIIGTYSASILANEVWMPKRFNYKDGLRDGSISMLTRVGFNLIREFFLKK
ncbi:MAG TPA: hypothetical protein PKY82_33705 [Pyrinomonadaceae bacterium]|nr:hypothetical protein [Pyrinomonadaceae bacterium]